MSEKRDAQREVTRIALSGIAGFGFALAGSGAIREHGVIDRPTEDVDLFTTTRDPVEFAVTRSGRSAERHGSPDCGCAPPMGRGWRSIWELTGAEAPRWFSELGRC